METFEHILEQYEPMISAVIRKANIYKNKEHFRQCARIALWQAWTKYDESIGDFAPYAYRTMLTTLYNELHRQNRDAERFVSVEKETLTGLAQHQQQKNAEYLDFPLLEEMLDLLNETEQQLLMNLYVHQLSYEELSKQMDLSIAALRKRRDRILKRLREQKYKAIQ